MDFGPAVYRGSWPGLGRGSWLDSGVGEEPWVRGSGGSWAAFGGSWVRGGGVGVRGWVRWFVDWFARFRVRVVSFPESVSEGFSFSGLIYRGKVAPSLRVRSGQPQKSAE